MKNKQVKKELTKAQRIKKAGKKLSLIPTNLKPEQALYVMQKTPTQYVYRRKGRGGQEFDYVKGAYVKKALNFAFGWMWDFNIVDKGREGDQIWVQGRLTIRNKKGEVMITKEQFGQKDIAFLRNQPTKMVSYGNDLKAAATDALKKCASELGIASDVYNKTENQEIVNEQSNQQQPKQTEQQTIFECQECGGQMREQEKTYSANLYGKALCRTCQVEAQKGNIKGIIIN